MRSFIDFSKPRGGEARNLWKWKIHLNCFHFLVCLLLNKTKMLFKNCYLRNGIRDKFICCLVSGGKAELLLKTESRLCQIVNFGAYNGSIFFLLSLFQRARNCVQPQLALQLLESRRKKHKKIICRLLSAMLLNLILWLWQRNTAIQVHVEKCQKIF